MKSRVTGDCQARFREKGGVKLPSAYSTMTMTVQTAFRLEPELIARLKNRARLERKSVNQFVEETLWRTLEAPLENVPLKLELDATKPIPENILCMTSLSIDDTVLDEKAKYILDKGK